MSETIARLEKAALACEEIELGGLAVLLKQAAAELEQLHATPLLPLGWKITKHSDEYCIASPKDGPGIRMVSEGSVLHSERLLYALAKDIDLTQGLKEWA